MTLTFKRATRTQAKLRMALIGPPGSGKTYTALTIATHLANSGQRVAVIDTEHGSASKYSGGKPFDFDVLELDTFAPQTYTEAILSAEAAGYDVLVIDSLSHAWIGEGGALEMVDKASKRLKGNSYVAWGDVTPVYRAMFDAIIGARLHIIATMRSKMDYVQEKDDDGKTVIRKLGMAPHIRDGSEYEFDIVAEMDMDHNLIVSKTRCPAMDNAVVSQPGRQVADTLRAWLETGDAPPLTRWNDNKERALAQAATWRNDHNITDPDILAALGVDRLGASTLTLDEANAAVAAYVQEQQDAPPATTTRIDDALAGLDAVLDELGAVSQQPALLPDDAPPAQSTDAAAIAA